MTEFELFGADLFGKPIRQDVDGPLFRKFTWPPFTVLDAKSGPWQERKRAWLALGIQSELGRGQYLMDDSKSSVYNGRSEWSGVRSARQMAPGGNHRPAMDYGENKRGDGAGKPVGEFVGTHDTSPTASIRLAYGEPGTVMGSGTSIFDPVLCELCYRWFAPAGGAVLDPFAGGSVRGIVAASLGLSYVGFDLAERQVEANREQAQQICPTGAPMPIWVAGDSTTEDFGGPYDFVFSCPPYGDLEVYSENPKDLSNVPHDKFLEGMGVVLQHAAAALKPERYAAFVVGDFRGPDGIYRGFPASMIDLARRAGLRYYNEAVLLTSIGSLPIRVSFAWDKGRKLGRTHQNLLVFAKGDPVAAAKWVVASWAARDEPEPDEAGEAEPAVVVDEPMAEAIVAEAEAEELVAVDTQNVPPPDPVQASPGVADSGRATAATGPDQGSLF